MNKIKEMAEESCQCEDEMNVLKDCSAKEKERAKEELPTTLQHTLLAVQEEECECHTFRKLAHLENPEGEENVKKALNDIYLTIGNYKKGKNPMVYNQCCLNFSCRKTPTKKSHGKSMEIKCTKFFRKHGIENVEDFIELMLAEIKSFPSYHQLVPGCDREHCPKMTKTASGQTE